ncbi:MAG: hypothetical protein K0R65_2341 [Crocinitomicaceae bacterium]|jgi:N-formylglutamate deformylase|nr:hypothetical protein [Crocinitomicaceae bacterium]
MEKHVELTNAELVGRLADCSLDPEYFSHEAHLRLAWLQIKEKGTEAAIAEIRTLLLNYVSFLGADDKYNETLTVAAVKTVNHFMLKSASDNFADFILEFPRLKTAFRELIAQHYSTDIFSSETARKTFLEPELLPFD